MESNSISTRVSIGDKHIRVAANSLLHQKLLYLANLSIPIFAHFLGLGSLQQGCICQQLELCGWVTRSSKMVTSKEERKVRTIKLSRKEWRAQKALGVLPGLDYKDTYVRRKRILYKITPLGREVAKMMTAAIGGAKPTGPIAHPKRSHSGKTKGYKYLTVPINVKQSVVDRMGDKIW